MDKTKIVKIGIVVAVVIFAIVYYFSTKEKSDTYDDLLTNNIIVENEVENTNVQEESNLMKVYVAGEVNMPGVIELEEGSRIEDAIEGAGGIKAEANLKNINLAYEVSDGEKIYIPNISEEQKEEETTQTSSSSSSNTNSNGKVNINKATVTELTSIPGIGASTAQKIITYREENGKFQSIEDIKKVSGIGESKYESMKDFIAVK